VNIVRKKLMVFIVIIPVLVHIWIVIMMESVILVLLIDLVNIVKIIVHVLMEHVIFIRMENVASVRKTFMGKIVIICVLVKTVHVLGTLTVMDIVQHVTQIGMVETAIYHAIVFRT
jgi:hypothetical protein